ncbi:MAG: alpha/beta hydrolase [Acidobacteria bacterium]|nr:alpha/beta hydrolase [Acidobacteriota bacterium]
MGELVPDQSGYVEADGQQIYWERFGKGDRETICLLNGLAMHTKAWYGFVPMLMEEYDVLLWDYLGQGNSSSDDVPCEIPRFCDYLAMILDTLGIAQCHLMGISYGGFVGLDFARRYQHRLHTLTISGILLSHEELFQMYEDISLRFYRSSLEIFELYTHYMYEKIFGEAFVIKVRENLGVMRQRFYERFKDKRHCLIRLTEAQDPFFAALDARMPEYRAIQTPTLIMAGAEDRAIPPWVQRKLCGILPRHRFELVAESGHCVYIEQPDVFFGNLKKFARTKSLEFDAVAPAGQE